MQRRSFLKTSVTAGSLAAAPHNFDHYNFGSGPPVSDRLYQGPFARRIGYRVRDGSGVTDEVGYPGLIIGFLNDGLAAVPGILRISVPCEDRRVNVVGCLEAGYPLPGKVRQAKFALPKRTNWKGLRISAEIEVKGQRHPVRWACQQRLNEDGSLTLRRTNGLGDG